MFNSPLKGYKITNTAYDYHPQNLSFTSLKVQNSNFNSPPLSSSSDPYYLLGLPGQTFDKEKIKKAYKARALEYHPDARLSSSASDHDRKVANEEFARINAAYDVLMEMLGENTPSPSKSNVTTKQSQTGWMADQPRWYENPSPRWYEGSSNQSRPDDPGEWNFEKTFEQTYQKSRSKFDGFNDDDAMDENWTSSSSNSDDIFSDFLSDLDIDEQKGAFEQVKEKLEEVNAILKQLESKDNDLKVEYDNTCEKIASKTDKTKFSSSKDDSSDDKPSASKGLLERLQLQERKSEIQARRNEVKKYLEDAKTNKLILQNRYDSQKKVLEIQELLSSTQDTLERERRKYDQTETSLREKLSTYMEADNKITMKVDSLKADLASKENEISEYNSQLTRLNEIVASTKEELESTKRAYSNELSKLKVDKQNLADELGRYEQKISNMNSLIEKEKRDRKDSESDTVKKIESISKEIDEKDREIMQLSSSLNNLNNEIASLNSNLNKQISDKEEAIITNANIIASLNRKISKEENEKNELKEQLEETKSQISRYDEEKGRRDENERLLAKEIKSLTQETKVQETKIQELEKKYNAANDENSNLTNQLRKEKKEREELASKNREMKELQSYEISALRKESESKAQEIKVLSAEVIRWESRYETETETLKNNISNLEKSITSLNSEKKIDAMSYEASLASKEKVISDLKMKLDATNDVLNTTKVDLEEALNYENVTSHLDEMIEYNNALKGHLMSLKERFSKTKGSKGKDEKQ
jgi:chromosome segregation ATPase